MNNILNILGAITVVGSAMPSVIVNNAHHINQNESILYTNYPTKGQDFQSTAELQLDPAIDAGVIVSRTIDTSIFVSENPIRLINKVHIKGYFAIIDGTNKKEYHEITILKDLGKSTIEKLISTYYDREQYGSVLIPMDIDLVKLKLMLQ